MRDVQPLETPGSGATPAEFRQMMGLFTTGVCVVSVPVGTNGVAAMTVNSFVSVSLDPMLISWSLQKASSQFGIYSAAEFFAVSFLSQDQGDLARRYAARGDSQLSVDDFTISQNGLPVIEGAMGYVECRRWSEFPAGDHLMLLGEVMGLSANENPHTLPSPLAFFNGDFCSIGV